METSFLVTQGAWGPEELVINARIFLDVLGALALGLLVGCERSYRGRAAGLRTYGFVCMASCALTVMCGHPEFWYGGQSTHLAPVDPSRVIQGIVTGLGFLGAGVIMRRDGLNISGLTTAASIWTVAAIGILMGVEFYAAAVSLSIVSATFMIWGTRVEALLPSRHAIAVTLHFDRSADLSEKDIEKLIRAQGYELAEGSFSIVQKDSNSEWRFVAVSLGKRKGATLAKLSEGLRKAEQVKDFTVAYARN